MKKNKLRLVVVILLTGYLGSYVVFRGLNMQTWEKDGKEYVIFPKDHQWTYYLYRPLSYVDGILTDMQFHIGPHQ